VSVINPFQALETYISLATATDLNISWGYEITLIDSHHQVVISINPGFRALYLARRNEFHFSYLINTKIYFFSILVAGFCRKNLAFARVRGAAAPWLVCLCELFSDQCNFTLLCKSQSNTPKITDSINKEAGNVICVLQHHCVTTMMSYCRVTPLVTWPFDLT